MPVISIGTTDVKMCARALVNIGMKPISSLSGDDDVTNTCNLMYPMIKKEVLSLYPWRATMAKKQLSRLTASPVNEYKYGFQLPTDRLGGPHAVYNSGDVGASPFKEYDIFGEYLYTDAPSIWVDYQSDCDESKLPPHVEMLIVYLLSARLAEILTDDSEKANKYDFIAFGSPGEKRYGGYFEIARGIDSRSRPTQAIQGFSLTDVRY